MAAATLNCYLPGHARLQSLVTADGERRRGYARALVQQLQRELTHAEVDQLVVMLEPVSDCCAASMRPSIEGHGGVKVGAGGACIREAMHA